MILLAAQLLLQTEDLALKLADLGLGLAGLVQIALDLAAQKGIPVQESVRQGGGNNAASIQTALVGAPSIVCGVPVRYAHATNCISTEFDFEATVQMVIALLENITEDVIRSI